MSDIINELQNKVAALTQTVNQLLSGSKSIPELPAQVTLDASSLIPVSRGGISEKISVQQIVNAAVNNDQDQLLSVGAITLDDNDLTIASISGKINNVVQSIPTPTVVNVPYCATGLSRIDLIVYNDSNNIERIPGEETAGGIIIAPPLPLETLLVTQISVSDSAIGDPTSPILGAAYIKKSFANMFEFNGTGANAIIPLNPNGYSEIRLINAGLTSISGVDLSLMTGPNFESPYQGKDFLFWNRTGSDITLNHEDFATADLPLFIREETNIVFPYNHAIIFRYDSGGLYEIMNSWNIIDDVIGLQDALDLKADKIYVDALVVGLWDDRGPHNASSNTFPSTGGSGTSGAIKKGDIWTISGSGSLGSEAVEIGDTVRALVDSPNTTPSNWAIQQNNIGYVPENSVNKSTTMTGNTTSNVVFLTAKAIYDWAVGKFQDILVSGTNIKTINGSSILGSGDLAVASKRTHFIEFSFGGGSFSNASGYWFYIQSYGGKYSQNYGVLSTLTPSDNFAAFNQAYGYNERVPFDCKVKNVYVHAFNNGATYNLEIAILNYKLASTYSSGVGSGVTDRVIIARETNNIVQGLNRTMADSNVDNDYVLTKGSCNRLFINTGGSTNAPIQNPLIIIEVEEV